MTGAMVLAAQLALVSGVVVAGTLIPAAEGPMVLLPIAGAREGDMVNIALAAGGRLAGQGRLPGSLIVIGKRDVLMPALARIGVLTVIASPALCSGSVKRGG